MTHIRASDCAPFQEFNAHRGKVQFCNVTLPDKKLVCSLLHQPESAVPKYIKAKYFNKFNTEDAQHRLAKR